MIIPYSKQSISKSDIKAVTKVLRSDYLTQGPKVLEFENRINKFVKSRFSVAVNSATSGLHLACLALGLKKGDWLWTSVNSFVASANCGLYCGAKIDLLDIDINDYNISINLLEKKLEEAKKNNKLPKIIIPVHFAGRPCKMREIFRLSKKYHFKIIEDASHALGAKINNKKIGACNFSSMTVFSFHPVKNITTAEGGIVTTNNKFLANKLKILRTHGINKNKKKFLTKNPPPWFFEQVDLGFNYRMNDLEGALGISQLFKLNFFIKKSNQIANFYQKKLKDLPIILPSKDKNILNCYHLFPIRINIENSKKIRLKLFNFFKKKNIFVNVHYIPIHYHPYYAKMGFKRKDYPNLEKYYGSVMSLPIFPDIKKTQLEKIIKYLKIFFKKHKK